MEPPVFSTNSPFGNIPLNLPKFDTPITPRENFHRAAKRDKPMWVPNPLTDTQSFQYNELAIHKPGKMQGGPDFRRAAQEDYTFIDPYGSSWTWVASAQGAMLTPGTKVLEDITDWEKVVKWPALDEWNFAEVAEKFMAEQYDPTKALHINIFQGCTEILVALLGGYGEGMLAMAEEPEAVAEFFDCFADKMIEFYELMKKLYPPLDYVTYHDDWGTERSPFFSPAMMENLVFKPTKKIVDRIKADGVFIEFHSCGNIEPFFPYVCDLGMDFLQIQRRAIDIPKMKEIYGDRIGFMVPIEDHIPGVAYTEEQMVEMARKCVDLYAKGGGYYPWIFESEPHALWAFSAELYCYSREFYDKES